MGPIMKPENENTNDLYAMLSAEARRELEQHEQSMAAPQGSKLVEHGILPAGLIILNSGAVRVSVPCSRRSASMATAQPGKVFGMRATITGELPEIDVTCLEQCRITVLPRDIFLDLLKARPEMYFAVARVLSEDLQMANRILSSTARRSLPSRAKVALKPEDVGMSKS